jgi:probable HAF family extracellular repeat protein
MPSVQFSCMGLGYLRGHEASSGATAVSGDGATVVGYSVGHSVAGDDGYRAFRWTLREGMQPLGPDNAESVALGVSDDGGVIVGWTKTPQGRQVGFRWTGADGMQPLGFLPAKNPISPGYATGVSGDGRVIVGDNFGGYRWTRGGGLEPLAFLADAKASDAKSISADGTTIVGVLGGGSAGTGAYRWSSRDGLRMLGSFAGRAPEPQGRAFGVSGDGTIVVGHCLNKAQRLEAFRWTAADGMRPLGFLAKRFHPQSRAEIESNAYAVSADGRIIVGDSINASSAIQPCCWTQADGMLPIVPFAGVPAVGAANGVSADGTIVVGRAENRDRRDEAFLCMVE